MNYHINSTISGKTEDSTELNAVFFCASRGSALQAEGLAERTPKKQLILGITAH